MTSYLALVKYVFVDVVRFTQARSAEAQADIVAALNDVVRSALSAVRVPNDALILLPTGDGLCIAIMGYDEPYDLHVTLALEILAQLSEYNQRQDDLTRRFKLRIGVNTNIDNVVTDINGRRNLAGPGINFAARAMSMCDGNQILVGQAVYEVLCHREKYMSVFRSYTANVKHDVKMKVYQIAADSVGLDTSVPASLSLEPDVDRPFPKDVAYFIVFAIKFYDVLVAVNDQYANVIWLWQMAEDAVNRERPVAEGDRRPRPGIYGGPWMPADKQLAYYAGLRFHVKQAVMYYIEQMKFDHFHEHCRWHGYVGWDWNFPTSETREKLYREWPELVKRVLES